MVLTFGCLDDRLGHGTYTFKECGWDCHLAPDGVIILMLHIPMASKICLKDGSGSLVQTYRMNTT